MAAESLLSGDVVADLTNSGQLDKLDKFLTDTITASLRTVSLPNDSNIIVASGGNGDLNLVITPPSARTAASMSDGPGSEIIFELPANVGIVAKSVESNDATEAVGYVKNIVDRYIPDGTGNPAASAQKDAMIAALTRAMVLTQGGVAINVKIRTIDFLATTDPLAKQLDAFALLDSDGSYQGLDSLVGANDIILDAGGSIDSQLFVLNLGSIGDKTLVLKNIDAATLAASGTVRADGSVPIRITSDSSAQSVSGGGGNDTLVGTGNDTLAGGAGSDVFGFSGKGKYIVTDFDKAGDKLAFDIAGVSTLDQLKGLVTSVVKTGSGITYHLGPDTSVTLVGVNASDLTASMIQLSIG